MLGEFVFLFFVGFFRFLCNFLVVVFIGLVAFVMSYCFLVFCSKENCVILKNVGKIGGDPDRVRSRLRHILSCIDKGVDFRISDVRVRGSATMPPIYEIVLEEEESASDLRKAFRRFTRHKNPVRRPAELEGVAIFNSVTLATCVRISVLRVSFL